MNEKTKSRIRYFSKLGKKTKRKTLKQDMQIETFLRLYNEKKEQELEEKRHNLEEKRIRALLVDLDIQYRRTLVSNLFQITYLSQNCQAIAISDNLVNECMKTLGLNQSFQIEAIKSLQEFNLEITREELFFREYSTNRLFQEQMEQFFIIYSRFLIKDNLLFRYLGFSYNDIFIRQIMSMYYRELVFMNGTVLNLDTMYLLLSSIRGGWSLSK